MHGNYRNNKKKLSKNKISTHFILGTAQLCADYGVNNKRGKQTLESATSFLDYAISSGTKILDTASSYDGAYRVIENSKKIIPKKFFIIDKVSSQEVENYEKFKSALHWPWLDKFSYKGGQVCLMLHNGKIT